MIVNGLTLYWQNSDKFPSLSVTWPSSDTGSFFFSSRPKSSSYSYMFDQLPEFAIDYPKQGAQFQLFKGWNKVTVLILLNYMSIGLVLGQIMKYFSNIHKLLMFGGSMYSSAVLSWLTFTTQFNILFWGGFADYFS